MPGSPCCLYAKQEFQCKHLGCSDVHPARFSFFQVSCHALSEIIMDIYTVMLTIYLHHSLRLISDWMKSEPTAVLLVVTAFLASLADTLNVMSEIKHVTNK